MAEARLALVEEWIERALHRSAAHSCLACGVLWASELRDLQRRLHAPDDNTKVPTTVPMPPSGPIPMSEPPPKLKMSHAPDAAQSNAVASAATQRVIPAATATSVIHCCGRVLQLKGAKPMPQNFLLQLCGRMARAAIERPDRSAEFTAVVWGEVLGYYGTPSLADAYFAEVSAGLLKIGGKHARLELFGSAIGLAAAPTPPERQALLLATLEHAAAHTTPLPGHGDVGLLCRYGELVDLYVREWWGSNHRRWVGAGVSQPGCERDWCGQRAVAQRVGSGRTPLELEALAEGWRPCGVGGAYAVWVACATCGVCGAYAAWVTCATCGVLCAVRAACAVMRLRS